MCMWIGRWDMGMWGVGRQGHGAAGRQGCGRSSRWRRGQGGVLGIKIGWVCDLDRAWERCLPRYSFTRLDGLARAPAPAPGYNFR